MTDRTGNIRIVADPDLVAAVLAALRSSPTLTVSRVSSSIPEADDRHRLYVRVRAHLQPVQAASSRSIELEYDR
jgi:hypothetical protein